MQEMMIDYSPIWISFKCAAFSIFITFFLGLFAARWMMTLKNKIIQLIFDGIFTLPLVLPPTVMGFFLLLIFGVNQPIGSFFLNVLGVRIAFSFSATVIAAVVISFPIMYRSARGALEQVDEDLVDAARTIGMSETSIFFKVLVPNALPGIISAGAYYHLREVWESLVQQRCLQVILLEKHVHCLWLSIVKLSAVICIAHLSMLLLLSLYALRLWYY